MRDLHSTGATQEACARSSRSFAARSNISSKPIFASYVFQTDQIDPDLDHPDPMVPLWKVVQDAA